MNFLEDIVLLHRDSLESQHIDFNVLLIDYNFMPRQKAGDEMATKAGTTVAPIRMSPSSNSGGPWKPPYLKTGLCDYNSLGLSGWVHPHLNRGALTQKAKVLKLRRRRSPRDYGKMKSEVMEL